MDWNSGMDYGMDHGMGYGMDYGILLKCLKIFPKAIPGSTM